MANLKIVAREALAAINEAYNVYLAENAGRNGTREDDCLDDCEINLYVYKSGHWAIEGAQYLTDHRYIVSVVSLAPFASINALYEELKANRSND